jgi:hypothetical protein
MAKDHRIFIISVLVDSMEQDQINSLSSEFTKSTFKMSFKNCLSLMIAQAHRRFRPFKQIISTHLSVGEGA